MHQINILLIQKVHWPMLSIQRSLAYYKTDMTGYMNLLLLGIRGQKRQAP